MDDGLAVGEGLQRGEAERLVAGGDHGETALAQERRLALALDAAEQPHPVGRGRRDEQAKARDLGRGARPGDVQPQPRLGRDRIDQQVEPLLADVDAPEEEDRARGAARLVGRHVHTVGNDRDPRAGVGGAHEGRVDVVEDDDVAVEPQPAALDRLERQPVAALHVRAAEHLHQSQHRTSRGERQQARRDRRGEALDPQLGAVHQRDQWQQQLEQHLPAARPGPADREEHVADATVDPGAGAPVGAAEHGDGVLVRQRGGDPRDHHRAATPVVRVADVVVDRQRDPAHGCARRSASGVRTADRRDDRADRTADCADESAP